MFHRMPRKVQKAVWGTRQLLYRIGCKLGIPRLGNGWFEQYQPDPGRIVKVRVARGTPAERLWFVRPEDVAGKRVLEAGCGTGRLASYCAEQGAARVVGIDRDASAIARGRSLFTHPRLDLQCDDLGNPFAVRASYDTVLFLAAPDAPELEDRQGLLARLSDAGQVLYVEGRDGERPEKYVEPLLKYTSFTTIECLGMTVDEGLEGSKGRPILRCDRVVRSPSFVPDYLSSCWDGVERFRVAVVGKPGTGKTYLQRQLEGLPADVVVLDEYSDLPSLNAMRKVVLFDLLACECFRSFDTCILLKGSERVRLDRLKSYPSRTTDFFLMMNSPPVRFNFRNLYVVDADETPEEWLKEQQRGA